MENTVVTNPVSVTNAAAAATTATTTIPEDENDDYDDNNNSNNKFGIFENFPYKLISKN